MRGMAVLQDHGTDQPAPQVVLPYSISDTAPWPVRSRSRVIIALDGALDIASAPGLARLLAPLAETGSHLIVHLARVRVLRLRRLIAVTLLQMILPIAANPAHMITA